MNLVSKSFLILFGVVSCSTGTRYNPTISSTLLKGQNVPEDGFFDPESNDLENAFTDFIAHVHPFVKDQSLSYTLQSMRFDPSLMHIKTFEKCVAIRSNWLSQGFNDEEAKKCFDAFWDELGVFNNEDVKEDSEGSDAEETEIQKNINKKKKKKKNKKKNKATEKSDKSEKTETSDKVENSSNVNLLSPEMEKVRFTLQNSTCQSALAIAVHFLNSKQSAALFKNVPISILDNPELLENIKDFSGFKIGQALNNLCRIMEDQRHPLTDAMITTLPVESLHKLMIARNFDISFQDLMRLMSLRMGFEFEEPFQSDHRTFRLFQADNPSLNLLPANLIINAIQEEGLTSNVMESVLAYHIRGELGIGRALKFIGSLYKQSPSIFEQESVLALMDLKLILNERLRMISVLNEVDDNLSGLLKTFTNNLIRNFLNSSVEMPLDLNDDDMEVALQIILSLKKSLGFSASFIELLESVPFSSFKGCDWADPVGLWQNLMRKVSKKFCSGRWARNFVQLISINGNLTDEFIDILRRHPGQHEIVPSVNMYDWFFLPINEVFKIKVDESDVIAVAEHKNLINKELKKILYKVNFFDEDLLEAVWCDESAMKALLGFPFALSQNHVDALVQTATGKSLLKANPFLLQRLPSYANFTLEDLNEFKLRLDDSAVQIGTLNVGVALAWLKQEEFLVNSSPRALFRPHPAILTGSDHWSLVNFISVASSPDQAVAHQIQNAFDFDTMIAQETSNAGKLSLIARCLIHMGYQSTWINVLYRIYTFNSYENPKFRNEARFLSKFEEFELPKLDAFIKNEISTTLDENYKSILLELKDASENKYISSFHVQMELRHNPDMKLEGLDSETKATNEFLCNLIRNGPGSDKFKRVWIHRAHLLVLLDVELKSVSTFQGFDDAKLGLIPLEDALLQWFLVNFQKIMKVDGLYFAMLRKERKMDPLNEKFGPEYKWFNTIFRLDKTN